MITLLVALGCNDGWIREGKELPEEVCSSLTSLLIAAAAMTMTCFASGSVGGGGLHRRTARVVLMTVVVCSHRWSWNPWGESVDDSANDTLDLDDLNSSDDQSQAYNQLLKYAARKAPSCADDQFSDLGRLVRTDSTALSLVKETIGVPNLSDQDVIRWMTNSSFFYRKCGADSCLRRGRSAVLVDCDCTREFGYKCIYAAGHPRLQMKVSIASYDELFGKLWDRSGSLITAITRILVVPVALAQDLIGLLYEAYAQRATAHPALLDTKLLDLPDPRVQKLAVNMLIGYLLTLVNSLCGVAINCEASEGMSRGEWFLRLVGAWVLLFGGLYLACISVLGKTVPTMNFAGRPRTATFSFHTWPAHYFPRSTFWKNLSVIWITRVGSSIPSFFRLRCRRSSSRK